MDDLLTALLPVLRPLFDMPFAFFGHSLGAFVAYESARRLHLGGEPLPVHLFLSGRGAPDDVASRRRFHDLTDRELIDVLRRLGGTPDAVLAHSTFMQAMLPAVRADFELLSGYQPPDFACLDLPLSVYGGIKDTTVDPVSLDSWKRYTRGSFQCLLFPGGHFFLRAKPAPIIDEIAGTLSLYALSEGERRMFGRTSFR
jgi:medium-chain acyl-[acyl-carrier-protein] hydrolase